MYRTIDTKQPSGWVYILTNKWKTVLYVGVTEDLINRVQEHRTRKYPNSFTSKYNCYYLVYYELHNLMMDAIKREKLLKRWKREWKIRLIEEKNADWRDLYEDLLEGKLLE